MTPKLFVQKYYPYALKVEKQTGISAFAILTQAALESGWGKYAPGNMFFGIKDTDGINGNEQLLTTTEYHSRPNIHYPVVLSITPTVKNGRKVFKYLVKDYFRKYPSPEESFKHHANFFLNNHRYAQALTVKHDPIAFLNQVAQAGYATDPNYAQLLTQICQKIITLV